MSAEPRMHRCVLLDIEGTTTPISFVYDTLFPYARERLSGFLGDHWHDPGVQEDVERLRRQALDDVEAGLEGAQPLPEGPEPAARYALGLMDADRKVTGLKSLQGRIWKSGYAEGTLRGEVFADVPGALERWKAEGKTLAIFSSGSIEAQKLLFRHSTAGDLTRLLSGYFDTTTGPKREPASYRSIAARLGHDPGEVLFATDVVEEARAAKAAGMSVVILDRPGNREQPEHDFAVATDFAGL